MVIDVRQVPDGLSRLERETALEAFADELPPLLRPVRCCADLDRMGDVITARLRYEAALTIQCARCLADYTLTVSGDALFFIKDEKERPPVPDDDSPDFYFNDRNELVDVSSVIYDDIMIALPLKPLCAEDCKGVAYDDVPVNDKDDNAIDPRWEALKKMRN